MGWRQLQIEPAYLTSRIIDALTQMKADVELTELAELGERLADSNRVHCFSVCIVGHQASDDATDSNSSHS